MMYGVHLELLDCFSAAVVVLAAWGRGGSLQSTRAAADWVSAGFGG